MKRRVWIKIVSCLLLVSLLAGGETVLYVGAEAETWPQETSVDEQGRTIKKKFRQRTEKQTSGSWSASSAAKMRL